MQNSTYIFVFNNDTSMTSNDVHCTCERLADMFHDDAMDNDLTDYERDDYNMRYHLFAFHALNIKHVKNSKLGVDHYYASLREAIKSIKIFGATRVDVFERSK